MDAAAGIVPKTAFSESAISSYLVVLTARAREFDTGIEEPDHAGQPQTKRKVSGRGCGVPSALKSRAPLPSRTPQRRAQGGIAAHGCVLRAIVRAYPGGMLGLLKQLRNKCGLVSCVGAPRLARQLKALQKSWITQSAEPFDVVQARALPACKCFICMSAAHRLRERGVA
jgi:hypothetical protein